VEEYKWKDVIDVTTFTTLAKKSDYLKQNKFIFDKIISKQFFSRLDMALLQDPFWIQLQPLDFFNNDHKITDVFKRCLFVKPNFDAPGKNIQHFANLDHIYRTFVTNGALTTAQFKELLEKNSVVYISLPPSSSLLPSSSPSSSPLPASNQTIKDIGSLAPIIGNTKLNNTGPGLSNGTPGLMSSGNMDPKKETKMRDSIVVMVYFKTDSNQIIKDASTYFKDLVTSTNKIQHSINIHYDKIFKHQLNKTEYTCLSINIYFVSDIYTGYIGTLTNLMFVIQQMKSLFPIEYTTVSIVL
jgi:hypothetical protein